MSSSKGKYRRWVSKATLHIVMPSFLMGFIEARAEALRISRSFYIQMCVLFHWYRREGDMYFFDWNDFEAWLVERVEAGK